MSSQPVRDATTLSKAVHPDYFQIPDNEEAIGVWLAESLERCEPGREVCGW